MQRVEMMIGPRDFATLKAEQFMQDVVSYYQVNDLADKLAGAITEGGFGSVPILSDDGKMVGIVSEFDKPFPKAKTWHGSRQGRL
jgi:CBS-domain-containing membrane protein